MAEAKIRVKVEGVESATRQLVTMNEQTKRQFEQMMNDVAKVTGKIDPIRSMTDLSKLKDYFARYKQEIKQQMAGIDVKPESFFDRKRQDIDSSYATRFEEIEKMTAGKGKQKAFKQLKSDYADSVSGLEETYKENEKQKTIVEDLNSELEKFKEMVSNITDVGRAYRRGETDKTPEYASRRQLGYLENARLQESILRQKLSRADEKDIPALREQLSKVQKDIDDKSKGTSRNENTRQSDEAIGKSIRDELRNAGGMFAGNIGKTTSDLFGVANNAAASTFILPAAITGLAGMLFSQGQRLETSKNKLSGLTGGSYDSLDNYGQYRTREGQKLLPFMGMSTGDFVDYSRQIAMSSGRGSLASGLESRAIQQLSVERFAGLENGALSSLNQESYRDRSADNILPKMLGILENSSIINMQPGRFFDTTRLTETIVNANRITSVQRERFGTIDSARSFELIASGEKMGGLFRGNSGTDNMLRIDDAIKTPRNVYQQAMLFSAIGDIAPNASPLQMMKIQQQGILRNGKLYEALFKRIDLALGDNDEMKIIALAHQLNLENNMELAETLYKAGPRAFIGVKGRANISRITRQAVDRTKRSEILEAQLEDVFQEHGDKGMDKVLETMNPAFEALGIPVNFKDSKGTSGKIPVETADKEAGKKLDGIRGELKRLEDIKKELEIMNRKSTDGTTPRRRISGYDKNGRPIYG
jgi:hypothetical protein